MLITLASAWYHRVHEVYLHVQLEALAATHPKMAPRLLRTIVMPEPRKHGYLRYSGSNIIARYPHQSYESLQPWVYVRSAGID